MTLSVADALDTEPDHGKATFGQKLMSGLTNPFIMFSLLSMAVGGMVSGVSEVLHLEWAQQDLANNVTQSQQIRDTQIAAIQAAIAANQVKIDADEINELQSNDTLAEQMQALKQAQADLTTQQAQVLNSIDHMQSELDILNRSLADGGKTALFFRGE